jgi:hypothetical protein
VLKAKAATVVFLSYLLFRLEASKTETRFRTLVRDARRNGSIFRELPGCAAVALEYGVAKTQKRSRGIVRMSADNNKPQALIPTVADHTLKVPKFEGDVTNLQAVALHGASEEIVLLAPSAMPMTKTEALIHAAWLVALADRSENFGEFRRILKAVLAT